MNNNIFYQRTLIFSFILGLLNTNLFSQTIIITDIDSKKNVSEALVKIYSVESEKKSNKKFKRRQYSNEIGIVNFELDQQPSRINISHISYETLDTLIFNIPDTINFFIKKSKNPLNEVVVTAQIGQELISKSVNSFTLLSRKNIDQSSSNNLADILSTQALFDINYDSFLGSSLSIQGMQGNNVNILIDGIPVLGRKGGQIDLSQINLSSVDRIEILKGPAAVSYGTNSTGGVINLITNSSFIDFVNLSTYYENIGLNQTNLNFKKNIKDQNIQFNIGSYKFNGYGEDTLRSLEWKPKKQLFGDFYWLKRINNNNKIEFKTTIFDEEITELGLENGQPFDGTAYDKVYTTLRNTNSLRYNKYTDFYDINTLVSYSKTEFNLKQIVVELKPNSLMPPTNDDFNTQDIFKSLYGRSEYNRFSSDIYKVQIGIDFKYEKVIGSRILNNSANIFEQSLFFQSNMKITDNLNTQLGIRIPYHSIYSAPIIPSFYLKYDFSPKIILRSSYAKGFRAPSVKELFLEFLDSNHTILGNPNLEEEKSHAFQTSLTYIPFQDSKKTISFDFELFLNDMNNKINLAQIESTNAFTYYNIDKSRYYGINLKLKSEIGKKNIFEFLWNRYHIENNSMDYNYPKQNFSALYSYFNDEFNFGFNLNWKLKSKSEYDRLNDSGELTTYVQDSYNLLNVSFQRNFNKINSNVKIGFKNIFDVKSINSEIQDGFHESDGAVISWGRTSFISFNYYPFRKD